MRRLCLALFLLTSAQAGPDGVKEPPELLVLEVGGQQTPVKLDTPFTIKVAGQDVTMKLTALPYRVFDAAGIQFRYPRQFAFSYESEEGVKMWSLEGPETLIVLQQHGVGGPKEVLKAIEEEIVAQFGRGSAKASDVVLELATRKLEGRQLDLSVADEVIRQSYYAFRTKTGTFIMIIQDAMDEGEPTQATAEVVALLKSSFKLQE